MTEQQLKDRRKRIEKLVLDVVKIMDNKKMLNYKRYEAMFKAMTDKEFSTWASSMGHEPDDTIQMFMLPFEEVKMPQIKAAADYLNIPLEEYIYFRHTGDEPIRSKMEVPVGWVNIKRVQQLLSKKNKYAVENETTDLKTGQVTSDSKVASISDPESFFLTSIGADAALREFLGPRADHLRQKQEMYHQISRDGYTTLESLPDDKNRSSVALNTLNTYMLASGIRSDLIVNSLKTLYTIENDR